MKKVYKIALCALCVIAMATSCVKDLDVENINPQQVSTLQTDSLFNKIYSAFALTGQIGPSDNGDLADIDEGFSDYFRMLFYANELTSDEASWIWISDPGISDLQHNTYGSDNSIIIGLYYRIYFTITLCNYYLDQVAADGTEETAARRAEVRFIRAFCYYNVMDLFANASFTETVSSEPGQRYTRAEYFNYVESELLAIESDLKDPGENDYGRIDVVADWLLLSRLYLNAEVYTGTAQWQNAKTYAENVLKNGYYELCPSGATSSTGEKFSAYQMLFLADNNSSAARKEIIYPVMLDGVKTTSYGATNFLLKATYSSDMSATVPSGTNDSWGKCLRVKGSLIDIFADEDLDNIDNVAAMTSLCGDDRALFYSSGFSRYILDETDSKQGYSCVKFRNVTSTGAATSSNDYVDTDLPLMRMAEAYLTYAEADTRLHNGEPTKDAADMINVLRERANAETQQIYYLEDILNEWAKEFWFEGRRRMDLVRFGLYGGSNSYTWEWKGGVADGTAFGSFRNIFALPVNELENNPNLIQNTGY